MSENPVVVVVGGGYGGITVAKALDESADVVLVDAKDSFFHNIAALRALVDPSWLERIFFPYERLLERGRFVHGRAIGVDGEGVTLATGETLPADYTVIATGSAYPFPAKAGAQDREQAHARYRAANDRLREAEHVLLLGGGPVGIELAGELKAAYPDKRVTIVEAGDDVLAGPYDQRLRDELRRQLGEVGVELLLASPLEQPPASEPGALEQISVTTANRTEIAADLWYRCYGVAVDTGYLSGALAAAGKVGGRLEVTPQLRIPGHENVYALGDVAAIDRPMAGRAMRQAPVVAQNIKAAIEGGNEASYAPLPATIFVPIGPEGGSGQMPHGLVPREKVAETKGRHMMVDRFAAMFAAGARAG
jgi:NADH dehydrogenase FAD-containing subunit